MRKISIEKALSATRYTIQENIDIKKEISITLPDQTINADSLVFFTERIGDDPIIEISFNGTLPYAVVVNSEKEISRSPVPVIRVNSVRSALARACSNSYDLDYTKIKIIGITGTNGKTTTGTLIFNMLRHAGYSVGFIGTGKMCINEEVLTNNTYSMTTPDPTSLYSVIHKMYNEKCDYIVMEVSSHSLALGKVSPILFEYGIFTNLNEEHLDFHDSIESYYQAKLSMFNQTKRGLFNVDDPHSRRALTEVKCEKASMGIIHTADAYATDIIHNKIGSIFFYYREEGFNFSVRSQLCGAFNVYNIMCALKCIIDLGIKPCIAKRAIEQIDCIDGRMQFIKSDITVIIDYAHTPNAFYNLFNTLISLDIYRQNITAVFGCGGERDRSKRKLIGKIVSEYANKIILTEDNNRKESFSLIVSDIVKGMDCKEYRVISNRESAIRTAISDANAGDIVAIVGKGHEKYKITGDRILAFDEVAIVKDALTSRSTANENKA